MRAYNVVRFRVKPGCEQAFEEAHRTFGAPPEGAQGLVLVRTGERTYCVIGAWDGMDALVAARPRMIANLDRIRPLLEDLGGGLGLTDPVSGEVVVEMG